MITKHPLIKTPDSGLIINKTTATIYELLKRNEKKQERPIMTDLSKNNSKALLQALARATALVGADTQLGNKLAELNINANNVHQFFESETRKFNMTPDSLRKALGGLAATGAAVSLAKVGVFKQTPSSESTSENENTSTPKKPGF